MYSAIESNKRKTWIMMIFFVVVFSLVALFVSYFLLGQPYYTLAILAGAIAYAAFSYFNAAKIATSISKAREVTQSDEPRLYKIVENLAITEGLPTPKVYIIDDPALIELIRRLSEFDTAAASTSPSSTSAGGAIAIASKEDIAAEDDKDGDVVMADGNSPAKTAVPESGSSQEGAPEEGGAPTSNKPPLDIEGLVAELDKFPRWRFQEQVS